ncbi:nuclear transport factor 2 family protein [Niastella caeni]|uniref:Nuclear transport factor 2 family protein n=1 Tax=Niastella caeni TaxID=2569763 RepID=A0A4S8HRC3_9BACT|nr:nuclear transport factor 2 family protein [Niastella caeni]THU37973.1 nuclear transport factor 2 family protein [Niastella caeni]
MTRPLLLVLLLANLQSAIGQQKDIDDLKTLNQNWLNSYPKKDTATLANIFADDFLLISPNGTKMTKNDILRNLNKQETVSIRADSVDVKLISSNVGLITAYTTFVLKVDGKEVTGRNCYQDVYVKRKRRWFAVAAHVTLLKTN